MTSNIFEKQLIELTKKAFRVRSNLYLNGWKYSEKSCVAIHTETKEVFHGSWEEFLVEKRFIDPFRF
jgi:hypothetical protein